MFLYVSFVDLEHFCPVWHRSTETGLALVCKGIMLPVYALVSELDSAGYESILLELLQGRIDGSGFGFPIA